MSLFNRLANVYFALNFAAAIYAARSSEPKGRFLGVVPYDFTTPTPNSIRDRLWSEERSLVAAPVFGAGWSINLREAARRLGMLDGPDEPNDGDEETTA